MFQANKESWQVQGVVCTHRGSRSDVASTQQQVKKRKISSPS